MTWAQANRIVGWLMVAGGVALLAIAGLAARAQVWDAAVFIGLCGLSLLGARAWVALKHRK